MCPFSHGFLFVVSVCCCLQSLNVCGDEVNPINYHNKRAAEHTHQSLLSLSVSLPSPPQHPSAVEQVRQAGSEKTDSRGVHFASLGVLQLEEGKGRQVVHGSHSASLPVSSLQPDQVNVAAYGPFQNIPRDQKNNLNSLFQFLHVARSLRTGVARPFRTDVVWPFRTGNAGPLRTGVVVSFYRTGFAAEKARSLAVPSDRSNDRGHDNSVDRRGGLLEKLQSVSSHSQSRSKRSPKMNKHSKKQGGRDAVTPTMSTSNSGTTAPHLTYTLVESVRRKVSSKRAGRMEAKARRRQKGGHLATINNLPQLEKEDGDIERKAAVASNNGTLVEHASNWNVSGNLASAVIPGISLSEQEKVKVKGQGHSASSSSQQQLNTTWKEPEMVAMKTTPYPGLDGKPLNLTNFVSFLENRNFQRQLDRQAQWAYLCLVLLICLMMWTMWYLGGLERCRYRPNDVAHFTDNPHTLSVEDHGFHKAACHLKIPVNSQHYETFTEVLRRKRPYLPMFNEPEWEEVLMCNRGSDP